jgi:hypothetical protein
LAGNSFGCHVIACADEGVGLALSSKVARHSEVTQLHSPVSTKQDIRWLNIPVDDSSSVEIRKAPEYAFGNLAENLLSCSTPKSLDFFINAV